MTSPKPPLAVRKKPKKPAVTVPKLVVRYLEREKTFETSEELRAYVLLKIKQFGWSASVLAYMTGMRYEEARSALRWIERLDEEAAAANKAVAT